MNTYQGNINPTRSTYNPFNTNIYQMPMIYGRMINSENDIYPNQIPNDGSMAYFPTADGTKVYARAWRPDGTIMPVTYVLDQSVAMQNTMQQPQNQQMQFQQTQVQQQTQPVQQVQQSQQPDLSQVLTQVSQAINSMTEKLANLEKTLTE